MTLRKIVTDNFPDFIRYPLRTLRRKLVGKSVNREEIEQYWLHPTVENTADKYVGRKTKYLVLGLVSQFVSKEARILEIGCNAGNHLDALFKSGFTNLSGIEFNKESIALMHKEYPAMSSRIKVAEDSVENAITKTEPVDMIFTLAVFQCLHPSSEWVFKEVAKRTKFLITIEDELEHSFSWRHFPRNYKKIFERLGMKQITALDCAPIEGLGKGYMLRVFSARQ